MIKEKDTGEWVMKKEIRAKKYWENKIKLKNEFATYLYLCDDLGKLKRFFFRGYKVNKYKNWKCRVKELMQGIDKEELEEFKRYLTYQVKTLGISDKVVSYYLIPLIASMLAAFLANLAFELPEKMKELSLSTALVGTAIIAILIILLLAHITVGIYTQVKEAERKKHFMRIL